MEGIQEYNTVKMRLDFTKVDGITGYTTAKSIGAHFEQPSNWVLRPGWIEGHLLKGPSGTHLSVTRDEKKRILRPSPLSLSSFVDFHFDVLPNDVAKADFKVLSRNELLLKGYPAIEIEYSFTWIKHIKKEYAQKRCRYLAIDQGEYFYVLEYSSAESDFPKYLEAYERLKSSFRFLD
jgi:hypothetical protein